jgi:hypothetical protein
MMLLKVDAAYLSTCGSSKTNFESKLLKQHYSGGNDPGDSSDSSDTGNNIGSWGNIPQVLIAKHKPKPVSSISHGLVIAGNTVITSQPTPLGVIQYENDVLRHLKIWIREQVGSVVKAPEIKGLKVQIPHAYSGANSIHVTNFHRLPNIVPYLDTSTSRAIHYRVCLFISILSILHSVISCDHRHDIRYCKMLHSQVLILSYLIPYWDNII